MYDSKINFNINMPNLMFGLKLTPKYRWYMVGCESKNIHQKDVCWKEIGQSAQNLSIILDTIVKKNWVTDMIIYQLRKIFHFDNK